MKFNAGGATVLSAANLVSGLIAPQTTYIGSIAGTAVWSMPFQGSSYKQFLIFFNNLQDAGGTITYPTPFVQQPFLYGDTTATGLTSTNTTTLTIAATGFIPGSGFAIVEGY
jgi:hypothetical protein